MQLPTSAGNPARRSIGRIRLFSRLHGFAVFGLPFYHNGAGGANTVERLMRSGVDDGLLDVHRAAERLDLVGDVRVLRLRAIFGAADGFACSSFIVVEATS